MTGLQLPRQIQFEDRLSQSHFLAARVLQDLEAIEFSA
jgi:hypothetical protein